MEIIDGTTYYYFPPSTWVSIQDSIAEGVRIVVPLNGPIGLYADKALTPITTLDENGNPWVPTSSDGEAPGFLAPQKDPIWADGGSIKQLIPCADLGLAIDATVSDAAAAAYDVLNPRVTALEEGGGTAAGFDYSESFTDLEVGDLRRLPIATGRTINQLYVRTPEPPSGAGAFTVAVDKIPAGSGTRITSVTSATITSDSRRSERATTSFTVDPGDELVVRLLSASGRLPSGLEVMLRSAPLTLPPLKGTITAPTIGTATASGNDVVVTATGGSGTYDTVLVERAGAILDVLDTGVWTGSYTDEGQSDQAATYRIGFSNRDYVAWSAFIGYEPTVVGTDMSISVASTPKIVNGSTGSDTFPVVFSRALAVGETVVIPVARSANGATLQTLVASGTGITWAGAPTEANGRGIINADATMQGYLCIGKVTTARPAGATVTLTFGGLTTGSGATATQAYSTLNTLGVVDQANSNSGTGTSASVPATATLSGQPAMALAFFTSLIRTATPPATYAPEVFTIQSTGSTNNRMGKLLYRTDLVTTAGVSAALTYASSTAWVGIVAVLKKG